jgi:S1-C subfamily serine protease
MHLIAAILAAVLGAPAATAQPPLSLQEALLRAKPAVALVIVEVGGTVTVTCGRDAPAVVTPPPIRETATGWFVSPSGWLVTNGRVIALAQRPPRWLLQERGAQAIRERCPDHPAARATPTLDTSISVLLSNGVRIPATIVKFGAPVAGAPMSGQDLALLRLEAADMPTLRLGDSASLQIGDPLHIVGFPGVVLTHELLNASATMEASITNGAVSGFRTDRAGQPVIQTDAPVAGGNSGGPALNRAGDVVGVLTFVPGESARSDAAVQGFNFVIPAAAVRSFLDDAPRARGEARRFDAAWQAGLRQYFLGNHRRARGHLAEANRLVPELADVRRVIADNEARLARQPWLPWRRMAIGLLALSAVGYATLLVRWWRRNQYRIRPSDVARLLDGVDPPVILDVRDAATYARSPVKIPRSVHAPLESLERERPPADPARTVVAYCT